MMKKIAFLLLPLLCLPRLAYAQQASISVSNPTDMQRHEVVEIDLQALRSHMHIGGSETFVLRNAVGLELPYQITHDGKVLVEVSVNPHSTWTCRAVKGQPRPVKSWCTGKWYPYRKDDVAWENDRCAYRVYGPALQRSGEKAYGIDVWVKNTPEPIVELRYRDTFYGNVLAEALKKDGLNSSADSVYAEHSFHLDHGNGMDMYNVGPTLGCGAPALMQGDSLLMPYCYKTFNILDNGPLRFSLRLDFAPNAHGITEHRIITLDKCTHFNRMHVWYDGVNSAMQLCSGVTVNQPEGGLTSQQLLKRPDMLTLGKGFVCYADPTDRPALHNSQVFVAVLFPYHKVKTRLSPDERNAIGVIDNYRGEPTDYFFGAAWSNYDVATYSQWLLLVSEQMQALQTPLKINVK